MSEWKNVMIDFYFFFQALTMNVKDDKDLIEKLKNSLQNVSLKERVRTVKETQKRTRNWQFFLEKIP